MAEKKTVTAISYITATEWGDKRLGFLQQAEQSLAAQTLSDIEWIIVSVNPPKDCLKGLVQTKHICSPGPPLSISRLFNRGIEIAKGDYLAFLDDDNRKMPSFGEVMAWFAWREGADAVYCFARVIDGESREIGNHHVSTVDYDFAWHTPGIYHDDELLVKREVMKSLGGFDPEMRCGEDYDLALRLLRDAKMAMIPVKLADIRVHGDQWTKKETSSFIQIALHQILAKHGRLNANCVICGTLLEGKPYAETHVYWANFGLENGGYQRACTHPDNHQ